MHDCTLPADRPRLVWTGELNPGQIIFSAALQQSPVISAILCEGDKTDIGDRHAAFIIYKMDTIHGVSDMAVDQWDTAILTRPFGTAICRVEDRARRSRQASPRFC